jgi:hypothetical protein
MRGFNSQRCCGVPLILGLLSHWTLPILSPVTSYNTIPHTASTDPSNPRTMPSVHAPQQPLRIALVGGGLGGLAFAISLQRAIDVDRANVELTLYEGAHAFAEIGAGTSQHQRRRTFADG